MSKAVQLFWYWRLLLANPRPSLAASHAVQSVHPRYAAEDSITSAKAISGTPRHHVKDTRVVNVFLQSSTCDWMWCLYVEACHSRVIRFFSLRRHVKKHCLVSQMAVPIPYLAWRIHWLIAFALSVSYEIIQLPNLDILRNIGYYYRRFLTLNSSSHIHLKKTYDLD